MKILLLTCVVLIAGLGVAPAAEIEREPGANMDSQLFPSMILATATQRPDDEEDDSEPDPEVLDDKCGSVGVSITAPKAGTKVQVTLLENGVMNRSSWSGVLQTAVTGYCVAPVSRTGRMPVFRNGCEPVDHGEGT